MIFDVILKIVSFMLDGLSAVLPSQTVIPSTVPAQLSTFMGYVNGWSWLFPVDTLITVFGIIVLLVFVEFVYFTTMYIFSIIHASVRG